PLVEVAGRGCSYTAGRAGWFGSFCGTSAAAPAVAGIAGLARSYAPTATNTAVEAALEATAAKISASVAYGRVDAYAALLALGGSSSPAPPPPPTVAPAPTPTPSATPAPAVTTLATTLRGPSANEAAF